MARTVPGRVGGVSAVSPLPEGLRPPTRVDAAEVLEVVHARDVEDLGRPDYTLDDVRLDWAGVDLERDAWVIPAAGGRLAAYAILLAHGDAVVMVHPGACGRGLGTRLRGLAETRARERGMPLVRQLIPTGNEPARALLLEAGYWPAQRFFRLRIDLAAAPPAPAGAPIRRFEPARDEVKVHRLEQAALSEVEGFIPQTLEQWRASGMRKPGWDPALWLVLEDDEGLAGLVLGERWEDDAGYIGALAVAPRARGRGHGRTLLLAAFAAFSAAGLRTAELSVHGANAAASRLYESVGMTPVWKAERWEKVLDDG